MNYYDASMLQYWSFQIELVYRLHPWDSRQLARIHWFFRWLFLLITTPKPKIFDEWKWLHSNNCINPSIPSSVHPSACSWSGVWKPKRTKKFSPSELLAYICDKAIRLLTSDMKIHNPCVCIHKGFVCCTQHHPQCAIHNFSYVHCIYKGCVFLYPRLAKHTSYSMIDCISDRT